MGVRVHGGDGGGGDGGGGDGGGGGGGDGGGGGGGGGLQIGGSNESPRCRYLLLLSYCRRRQLELLAASQPPDGIIVEKQKPMAG
jgi:hypothetical protein